MNRSQFFEEWSALHGGVQMNPVVKGWLTVSYFLIKPLRILRISPNAVTFGGVFAAVGLVLSARTWWAPILIVLSLILDGIDGSLAIITGKSSTRGAIWDSFADRISEALWGIAFYRIGAPSVVIFFAWLLAFTQEYLRARTSGLGYRKIDFVTIAERPVRAILLTAAILAYLLDVKVVTAISVAWLVMQAFSFLALSRHTYKKMTTS
jgi:CDP-diacylglycerol--glycerol-3-phosphate 3-phosphatidyltransferase